MRVEAWSFPNARGERLSGRLDRLDGAPRAWALFAHCLDQAARIARLGKALLILHAPQDAIVGIDNARAIFDAARPEELCRTRRRRPPADAARRRRIRRRHLGGVAAALPRSGRGCGRSGTSRPRGDPSGMTGG
jgi:hypothetical protein